MGHAALLIHTSQNLLGFQTRAHVLLGGRNLRMGFTWFIPSVDVAYYGRQLSFGTDVCAESEEFVCDVVWMVDCVWMYCGIIDEFDDDFLLVGVFERFGQEE